MLFVLFGLGLVCSGVFATKILELSCSGCQHLFCGHSKHFLHSVGCFCPLLLGSFAFQALGLDVIPFLNSLIFFSVLLGSCLKSLLILVSWNISNIFQCLNLSP